MMSDGPDPARASASSSGAPQSSVQRPGSYFRMVQFTNDIRDSTLKAGTHDSSMDTWSAEEPRLKLPSTFKAESKLETFDTTVSREVLAAMKKQQERSASEKLLNTAGAALQWKLKTSRSRKEAKADLPPIVHQTFRSREHQRMFSIGSIGVTAPDVRTIISQKDLETFGIPSATLDKVYRLVELYTVGFQNLLSELLEIAEDPVPLLSKVWTAFLRQAEHKFNVKFSSELSEFLQHMEGKHGEMFASIRKCASDIKHSETMHEIMATALEKAKEELGREVAARSELEQRLAEKTTEAEGLRSDLETTECSVQQAEDEIAELALLPVKMSEFSRRVGELTRSTDTMQLQLQRAQRENMAYSQELEDTRKKYGHEVAKSTTQKKELSHLRNEHSEMKERWTIMKSDLEMTKAELELKAQEAEQAMNLRIQLEEEEAQKREYYERLQQALKEAEETKRRVTKEVQILRVLRMDLDEKLKAERTKSQTLQVELDETVAELRKYSMGTEEQVKLAEKQKEEAERYINELKAQNDELESAFTKKKEEMLAQAMEFKQKEVALLEKMEGMQEAAMTAAKRAENALALKEEELAKTLVLLEHERTLIEQLKEDFQSQFDDSKRRIAELEREKDTLRLEIEHNNIQKEELRKEIAKGEEEKEALRAEMKLKEADRDSALARVTDLEKEVAYVKGRLKKASSLEAELRNEAAEARRERDEMKESYVQWQEDMRALEQKMEDQEAAFQKEKEGLEEEMEQMLLEIQTQQQTIQEQNQTIMESLGGLENLVPKTPKSRGGLKTPSLPKVPETPEIRLVEIEKQLEAAEKALKEREEAMEQVKQKKDLLAEEDAAAKQQLSVLSEIYESMLDTNQTELEIRIKTLEDEARKKEADIVSDFHRKQESKKAQMAAKLKTLEDNAARMEEQMESEPTEVLKDSLRVVQSNIDNLKDEIDIADRPKSSGRLEVDQAIKMITIQKEKAIETAALELKKIQEEKRAEAEAELAQLKEDIKAREDRLHKIDLEVSAAEKKAKEAKEKQAAEAQRLKEKQAQKPDVLILGEGGGLASPLASPDRKARMAAMLQGGVPELQNKATKDQLIQRLVVQVMQAAKQKGMNVPKWQGDTVKQAIKRVLASRGKSRGGTGSRPGTSGLSSAFFGASGGQGGGGFARVMTPMNAKEQEAMLRSYALQLEEDELGYFRGRLPDGAGIWKVTKDREIIIHSVKEDFPGLYMPPLQPYEADEEEEEEYEYADEGVGAGSTGPGGAARGRRVKRRRKKGKGKKRVRMDVSHLLKETGYNQWLVTHTLNLRKQLQPSIEDLNEDHIDFFDDEEYTEMIPTNLYRLMLKQASMTAKDPRRMAGYNSS